MRHSRRTFLKTAGTGAVFALSGGLGSRAHARSTQQTIERKELGQNLIVTAGCGWVQRWGGRIEEIRPGDVVWIPPGEKHWHGAAATTAMTHIAIYEFIDGKGADWMEAVNEEQYQK
jgi:hypothetical protein